ncbi:type I restriction enzyme S subunit [Methanococcus maripaludis]|uniref:Type I restriction enzyme S subunit n=1 Tax=Methanococcus maripaludis TaxID=39152 RepID=A0A7J9S8A3_METMI|nr:restriction endonuclease subunit S [Methanococcus maripaludis]MBB6402669.1 type I restriction enzyme S subunit [Methanococcus maripaludis]
MARAMKDSSIEWIGDIPADWEIRKLDSVADKITDFVASGSFASLKENVRYRDEPNYAMLIRTADLSNRSNKKHVYIDESAYTFLSNSNLYGGEIILPNIGSVGDVYIYEPIYKRASLAPNSIMVMMKESNRFYYYWFLSPIVNNALKNIGSDSVQAKFNKTQLRQFKVARPPIDEQQQIAKYLDEKVGQIDSIIDKTKSSIDDYKSYKQSIITETVTKGLDPTVTMKDSSIDWLPQIPKSWNKTKLKNICRMKSGDNLISEEINSAGEYAVYGGNGIRGYYPEYNRDGTYVLIGRQGALCGNVKFVEGKFWATEHALVTEFTRVCNPKYFLLLLQTMNLNQYSLSSAQPGLSANQILNLHVCLPELREQTEIATFLDSKCKHIDSLVEQKQQLITELESYKKSLIYEVVTGKKEIN